MLAASSPPASAFAISVERSVLRMGGMSSLGLPPRRRSMPDGGGTVSRSHRFRTWTVSPGKEMKVETIKRDGDDIWALNTEKGFPEHLVIMVNGLVGSAEDWRFAAAQFLRRQQDKVIVHRSECNSSRLTFDGVDLMGERLADEVLSVVNKRGGLHKISFVAHSLGGLIARYAIGRLYDITNRFSPATEIHLKEDRNLQGRIAGLEAMNFITFASPHLGSRGHKQLPFLCGLPFLEQRASEAAHLIVGRTGKHLFLTDNDDGRPPLLLRMVHDCDDIKFMSALRSFKRRVTYANANYDHMVGWRTSSIRRQQDLPKYHLLIEDENYQHIVHVDKGDSKNAILEMLSDSVVQNHDLEEAMIQGLTQVPWERVDVSFQKSGQRYIAHNTIQELDDAISTGEMKLIVVRKGQLRLYAGQPLVEVEKTLRSLLE